MNKLIKSTYESKDFQDKLKEKWYLNFVIKPENSTTVRTMQNVVLPELTDLGWIYVSVCNIFEDKLATAEKIVLGYLLAKVPQIVLNLDLEDRDRRQLLNALMALESYKSTGTSDVMLPLDMATSALILKSAMYRCVKTMEMVGLTTKATTVDEQLLEPVADSYTILYETALSKLPPNLRAQVATDTSRDTLKKTTIMPDFYGSSAAILRIDEQLRKPYVQTKEELIPAHIEHVAWGKKAGEILAERDITHPQWTCSITGRNVGYICEDTISASVVLPDGVEFDVSKTIEATPYHLPLIANTVHSADSSILVAWYEYAAQNNITTFTTHDAVNATANNLNQMRQIIAEQIVVAALDSPVLSMSKELDLPLPNIGSIAEWAKHFKPHNFMT